LYLFLVEQAQRVLLDHVRSLANFGDPSQVDFLQALRTQMSATVQAALAHPREARLVQRAYLSPAPIRDALERQGNRVRNAHMQALLSAAQARGELAPDLDPEIVAHILAAVAGGLGPLAMQRLGLDSEGETPIPAEKLDPAVLEPVFDGVLRLLRFGLDPRSRPGSHAEVQ
jgi:AcrR family transcriptional regulator